jgi:hypothetical protein
MHQEQPTSPMAIAWLVRPERSPMQLLPFRAPASSVADVKALVDWRLNHNG